MGCMKRIAVQICVFNFFFSRVIQFQSEYLILSLLKILLSWLSSYCPKIKTLHDVLPRNIYFMRKLLVRKSEITCFAVCPKCHSLCRYKGFVVTHRTVLIESAKC